MEEITKRTYYDNIAGTFLSTFTHHRAGDCTDGKREIGTQPDDFSSFNIRIRCGGDGSKELNGTFRGEGFELDGQRFNLRVGHQLLSGSANDKYFYCKRLMGVQDVPRAE